MKTHRVARFLCAAVIVILVNPVAASNGNPKSPLKIRWSDKRVVIVEHGKTHFVDLNDDFAGYAIDKVKLLFQNRSQGVLYLLFDVSGPSRGRAAAMHYCGAGEENSLIWVALEEDWDIRDIKSYTYASCLSTIEPFGDPPFSVKQGRLNLDYLQYEENGDAIR